MVHTAYERQNLIDSVIRFGHRLRGEGFIITPAHLENTLQGLEVIDIGVKAQFRTLLRATLVSNANELQRFQDLFQEFWDGSMTLPGLSGDAPGSDGPEGNQRDDSADGTDDTAMQQDDADWGVGETGGEKDRQVAAGLGIVEAKKDFKELSPEVLGQVEALVLRLAIRLGLRLSRRQRIARQVGKIDFRKSFRSALRYGGELLEFRYRRPKSIPSRIHLVLDISGSMDIYNRFFVIFMYGLQQTLANARSFVFSTHLTWITHHLKSAQFHEAWKRIQTMSVNWSGGTEIGSSLMQLYCEHLGSGSARRAVVIIVSDGWDRGNPEILNEAMGLIHQRCRHLFWLNPLLSSRDYEPVCTGMQTALPHIDSFLPFDTLDSLVHLCQKIETIW
ncbi:MAG: VWA domain-containing protein [Desulfobacterales bacterium]|jgi:hypothetical protein